MSRGLIIGVISEFCTVISESDNKTYQCKAKGIFRHRNIKLITGDIVDFEIVNDQNAIGKINSVFDRKNQLYRPKIANIDQVVIVTATMKPEFASYLLNKYLAFVQILKIEPILIFTKVDLLPENSPTYNQINWYKKLGYTVFLVNNKSQSINDDLYDFKTYLSGGKVTVFTGQTGAGKSTTLNNLIPGLKQHTQEISKALNRGKHTTTSNQLFAFNKGYIADTPGFSSFEINEVTQLQLAHSYSYFENNFQNCKFNDCLHIHGNRDVCAIKKGLDNGEFPDFIYQDYLKIQDEILSKQKRRY